MTDVIYKNTIMANVESEMIREINALKKQMQEEGLDKTSTYCKADYKKPVGIIAFKYSELNLNVLYSSMSFLKLSVRTVSMIIMALN
jgi:hypothetical protein